MLILLISVLWLAIMFALGIGIVYQTAKNDRQLTFENTGEVKFIVRGGTIVKLIIDETRDYYDDENDILYPGAVGIPQGRLDKFLARNRRRAQKFLSKFYSGLGRETSGIGYVSIRYPLIRVHSWQFSWPKLEARVGKDGNQENVFEKYNIVEKSATVTSLFIEYTYPILVKDIELEGNIVITILINVILVVRKPVYLIGTLHGKFMAQVDTDIAGLVDNAVSKTGKDGKRMTDEEWRGLDKEDFIDKLFVDPITKEHKMILADSFVIRASSYVMFDYDSNSKKMREAIEARKIEEKMGQAKLRAAELDAQTAEQNALATERRGRAAANVIKARYEAAASVPGGMEAYRDEVLAEGMKEFGGNTLVVNGAGAGGNTMVSVPSDGSRQRNKPEEEPSDARPDDTSGSAKESAPKGSKPNQRRGGKK